jgi:hypothetical protein
MLANKLIMIDSRDIASWANIPANELFIFPAGKETVIGLLVRRLTGPVGLPEPDSAAPTSPQGTVPNPFSFALSQVKPAQLAGGTVKVVDSSTFKVSTTIAAAGKSHGSTKVLCLRPSSEVTIEPGAMR